jgi:hypothetical protein
MISQPKKADRKKPPSVAASREPRLGSAPSPEVTSKAADDTFVGEPIAPEGGSFSASAMAQGKPGLPGALVWKGRRFAVLEVLEEWKESGPCHHGSGEQYVRKHWFRIRTTDNLEMRIYFERQARSAARARWHLFSIGRGARLAKDEREPGSRR